VIASSTLIIIAITVAVSWTAFSNQKLMMDFLFWPPALERGEYQRLLTYGLVHADFTHLLVNMLTLFFFGSFVEQFYRAQMGTFGFAFFYTLGIIASILPTWMRHRADPEYRSLGASGAVMAVLMASVLFDPWMTIYVFFAIPLPAIVYAVLFVVYEMWADRSGRDRVNHSAHLWGAAFGVVFTVLVEPRVWTRFLRLLAAPHIG
jgi:membrane associated rhomboid family serine protease